jgi:hypothetical protein
MICHYCCRGYIADGFDVQPCPECGGSGIIHCCEGERPDQCPEHSRGATPEAASPVVTKDEARRIAENIAKLPELLSQRQAEED